VSRWEGFATVRDLLVDDTHVYWSTVEGLGGFVVIHVQKAKKCGGPPALVMAPVADHPNRVGPMVSAGEYLFYPATDNTNRTFIARVHK
jgi:hypothetical protein